MSDDLIDIFNQIIEIFKHLGVSSSEVSKLIGLVDLRENEIQCKMLSEDRTPITELDLSVRTNNCLIRAGYKYVYQLKQVNIEDLIQVKNINFKSIKEIYTKLIEFLEKNKACYARR